jgi:hypothetical protein
MISKIVEGDFPQYDYEEVYFAAYGAGASMLLYRARRRLR